MGGVMLVLSKVDFLAVITRGKVDKILDSLVVFVNKTEDLETTDILIVRIISDKIVITIRGVLEVKVVLGISMLDVSRDEVC